MLMSMHLRKLSCMCHSNYISSLVVKPNYNFTCLLHKFIFQILRLKYMCSVSCYHYSAHTKPFELALSCAPFLPNKVYMCGFRCCISPPVKPTTAFDAKKETLIIHHIWYCTHKKAFINLVLTWLDTHFHDVDITLSKEDFIIEIFMRIEYNTFTIQTVQLSL